jgi:hypothetical protein
MTGYARGRPDDAPDDSPAHQHVRSRADPDPDVRNQAVREAAEFVQAAYREVAGG